MVEYAQLRAAARQGDLDAVKACIAEAGGDAREVLTAGNFLAFCLSCFSGHTDTVSHFLTAAGEIGGEALQEELLTVDNCGAFRAACAKGHIDIATHLLTAAEKIDGLPLVKDILSATVADHEVMEEIAVPQTAGAAIGCPAPL